MITETKIQVARQEWRDNDTVWQMIMTTTNLNRVESLQLDITTIHKTSNGLAMVCWRPSVFFYDPVNYIQYMETLHREPYL